MLIFVPGHYRYTINIKMITRYIVINESILWNGIYRNNHVGDKEILRHYRNQQKGSNFVYVLWNIRLHGIGDTDE